MGAPAILTDLQSRGLRLQVNGQRLRVAPRSRLTEELRTVIRAHKADLLQALYQAEAQDLDANAREHFEERAAIGEYDGELSRADAERQAARRVFEYRLTDSPRWLTMIAAPGEDLAQVERSIKDRFGAANIVAVRPYQPHRARNQQCTANA